MVRAFKHWYLRRRFAVLFYSLLVTFSIGPILMSLGMRKEAFSILIAINQMVALVTVGKRFLTYWLIPGATIGAAYLANIWFDSISVDLTASPVGIVLAFATVQASLYYVVRARHVDAECIYAALSAYLFFGICLAMTYWFVEQVQPGSFSIAGVRSSRDLGVGSALYFSFITLTTTGYGDVLPLSDVARGLAACARKDRPPILKKIGHPFSES